MTNTIAARIFYFVPHVDPGNSDVYACRGTLEFRDPEAGAAALEKAGKLDAGNVDVHDYSGIAFGGQKRRDLTVIAFEDFLKPAPGAPEAAQVRVMLRRIR